MAWTTPMTAVSGTQFTAAQFNTHVRDNLLETLVAKVTASAMIGVSTGPNALAARGIDASIVTGGSQTTSSSTFTDLTTVGPSVTLSTGSQVLVILSSYIANSTAYAGGLMAFAVNGTVPGGTRPLRLMSPALAGVRNRASVATLWTGLTPGSNTFKAVYATIGGGTADFDEREIFVLPLN